MKRILDALNVPWTAFGGTCLALIAVLAFCYQSGVKAAREINLITVDRDSIARWADVTCALTGKVYRAPGMKREEWGRACQSEIQALADFRRNTTETTNTAMANHLKTQVEQAAADLAAARRANEQTARALKRMEAADASVKDDHVGGDWFGALNELGGLRAPGS